MGFWTKSKKENPTLSDNAKEILKSADEYGLTSKVMRLKHFIDDEQEWVVAVGYIVTAYQEGYIKGLEGK